MVTDLFPTPTKIGDIFYTCLVISVCLQLCSGTCTVLEGGQISLLHFTAEKLKHHKQLLKVFS